MRKTKLLSINVINDDGAGLHAREMDFTMSDGTMEWLKHEDNRTKLADWLSILGTACANKSPPFHENK